MKGQFTIKYLNFREVWKIPCVIKFFYVVPKFLVFSLYGKIDDQIPCFPCEIFKGSINMTNCNYSTLTDFLLVFFVIAVTIPNIIHTEHI